MILMRAVGDESAVLLHNMQSMAEYFGAHMAQMEAVGCLSELTRLNSEAKELRFVNGPHDFVLLIAGYRDFFHEVED